VADKTVTYRLIADIGAFRAQMAQAGASVKAAATEMTGATASGAAFRNNLSVVGAVAGKVGLVAAAGLGAAVFAAANFDEGMSKVQAATHESAANMDLLRAAALKAGADTKFSATEAAGGIEALAKAGVSTKDILGGGLNGALALAAAGELSVGDAAETAATAMTQFNLSGKDVPHIADLLAAGAGKAQGEVSDLSMALKQSGLIAGQMGVSIEETVGTLSAFASAGLIGSDAGTSFKTMLLRLANPASNAKELMDKLNISAYDAQGNFVGIANLAGQLQTAFKGQSQATRDAALATIFGSDAIRGANVLYRDGAKGIKEWTNKVNDQGYAVDTARIKMDNLKGDLEQLKGSLETALIGTGESAQGPLRSIVQGLTSVVNAYGKLPSGVHGGVAGALGLTALAGIGTFAFAKIVTGIAETKAAMDGLNLSASRTGRALKGLGTATAIAGGVLILDDAIDSLLSSMRDAPAGVNEMTHELLDLSKVKAPDLSGFDSLGSDLDFFVKNKPGDEWTSWIPNITGLLPGENSVEKIDRLKESFASLDAGLANIANSGSADQARQAFASLAASQNLTGAQQKALLNLLPQYKEALAGAGNAAELAGAGAKKGADGIGQMGSAARGAVGAVQSLKGVIADLNGLLDRREALRNYKDSLDALRAAVKQSGAGSREAIAAFDDVARNIVTMASHMHGVNKVKFLAGATDQLRTFAHMLGIPLPKIQAVIAGLLASAEAADKSSGAQRKLITQYHLTPKQASTVIRQVNMGKSQADIRDLLRQYGLTPRQVQTAIHLLGASSATSQVRTLSSQLQAYNNIHAVATVEVRRIGGPAPVMPANTSCAPPR
jgi:TP901 family phage tail tape measure protein